MSKKKIISAFLIGTIVSAISLYYAFQNIPIKDVVHTLKTINYLWIVPSVGLVVVAFIFRAIRWKMLLQTDRQVSFSCAYHPLVIGFMLNCTIPARIGEIARPIILKAQTGVNLPTGIGSVVMERFFDLLFLIICLTVVLNRITISQDVQIPFGSYILNKDLLFAIQQKMILLFIFIFFFILAVCYRKTRNLTNSILKVLPHKIHQIILNTFDNVVATFTSIKDIKTLIYCILTTCVIWLLHAASYFFMAYAFHDFIMSLSDALFYMVIICFFITLPSVPGYWGLWEAGGIFALLLLGFNDKAGAAYTLVNHAIQIVPVILLGLISFAMLGLKIKDIRTTKS